eukprot:jgi/Mesvir1/24411/Mv11076-RA.1
MWDGILCRVLLYSNLLYGGLNYVTLEVTTPLVNPHGFFLCFPLEGFSISPEDFLLTSIRQGGSQFELNEEEKLPPSHPVSTAPFLSSSSAAWSHNSVEFGTIRDVLGTDPYYATSYRTVRYDDLTTDKDGAPLDGLFTSERGNAALSPPPSNCALITADWIAGTRYQITFQIRNPASPSPSLPTPVQLRLWVTWVTYSRHSSKQLLYAVRGDKRGLVCTNLKRMATQLRMPASCASNPSFGCPPASDPSGADSAPFVGDTSCVPGYILSPRWGGECVRCQHGTSTANGTCACASTHFTLPVGPLACSPSPAPSGSSSPSLDSSRPSLGRHACTVFSEEKAALLRGERSDKVVQAMYMDTFLRLASPLVDTALIIAANTTFREKFLYDPRRPDDITRRTGLLPNCALCEEGHVVDAVSGLPAPLRDPRYASIHKLRLIGYVLSLAGAPCTELFDPDRPMRNDFGSVKDGVCVG